MEGAAFLTELRSRTDQMIAALGELVSIESPSTDRAATARCAAVASEIGTRLLGAEPERYLVDGRTHLRWDFGDKRDVLLAGHIDTVWPVGTIDLWPYSVDEGVISGPGCFDMKGGVVQLLFALNVLDDLTGVSVILTTDEEIGSPSSRDLMRESAAGAAAALVLEPSASGALKTARKGVALYRLDVLGLSAHAGLEPERGLNAAVEMAHQLLAIDRLTGSTDGLTVTPTIVRAGTSSNSVPADASADIDVRTFSNEDAERVDAELRALTPVTDGISLTVTKVASFPPLPRSSSEALFQRARRIADVLDLGPLTETAVGGGSDGSVIASYGVPTLDGLGPVGGGAHAKDEHVIVSSLPERAAIVAALTQELLDERR